MTLLSRDTAPGPRPHCAGAHRRAAALLLALAFVAALADRGAAQASHPRAGLALTGGGVWQVLDDAMASPVRYRGAGGAVGASFQGQGGGWLWAVRGSASWPRLTSHLTTPEGGYQRTAWFGGAAELLSRVRSGDVELWAGAGLAVDRAARQHVYAEDAWMTFQNAVVALQVVGRAGLDVWGGHLSGTLAAPVAGLAVRPAHAGVIDGTTRVTAALPPELLFFRHRLEFAARVAPRTAIRGFLDGWYFRHNGVQTLAGAGHRLGVAVEWTWGAP